uniref:2-phosphoxylose phosphatase 1 n=1 Tax=Syphacia muris TaxID=451379 RepID=A0A0N5B134_9BILA
MIWRHGDRAPERVFDGIKLSKDSFPNGLGNLTQLGKLQVELFAEKIKKRYFSDDDMRDRKVLIRSTQVPRTIESANIIASVLRLPNTSVTSNVNLKIDTEGNPFYVCPTVEEYVEKVRNSYRMVNKYKDVYSLIEEKVNYTGDVHPVLDLLHCMNSHNIPTPEWSHNSTLIWILKYLSWNGLAARYGLKPYLNMTQNKLTGRQIDSGAVLKGVVDKLKSAVECDRELENDDCDVYFSGLSAHDITIAALFSTFPNYEKILSSVPFVEYVANVAFEVWRLPNRKYAIKAFYANSFREEPTDITEYLPGCENYEFCPFNDFIETTQSLYYEDVNYLYQQCQLGKGSL